MGMFSLVVFKSSSALSEQTSSSEICRLLSTVSKVLWSVSTRKSSTPSSVSSTGAIQTGMFHRTFIMFPSFFSRCMTSNVRSSCSILLADVPGFQNLAQTTQSSNAGFEDLCHNYLNERLHVLLHETTFTSTLDLYAQVGRDVKCCASWCLIMVLRFNLRKTFRVILMRRR